MTEQSRLNVTVLVDDAALQRIRSIARRLEKAGMKVEEVQEEIGTITGSVPADELRALEHVEGVSGVEEQRQVSIAPPGSEVQ
ncbi:MAG TPA: hypothetical protein VI356_19485 [Myxococcales bacterium]